MDAFSREFIALLFQRRNVLKRAYLAAGWRDADGVVLGPGDIKNAHQTGEFVPKDELHRCAELLESALLQYCG